MNFFPGRRREKAKRKQVPSPRNLPIYKTNLTNRHEKNSYVWCKGNNSEEHSKIFQIFFFHIPEIAYKSELLLDKALDILTQGHIQGHLYVYRNPHSQPERLPDLEERPADRLEVEHLETLPSQILPPEEDIEPLEVASDVRTEQGIERL